MSDTNEFAASASAAANAAPPPLNADQYASLETEVENLCVQCLNLNSKDTGFRTDMAVEQLDMLKEATPDDKLKAQIQEVITRIEDGAAPASDLSHFVKEAFSAAQLSFIEPPDTNLI